MPRWCWRRRREDISPHLRALKVELGPGRPGPCARLSTRSRPLLGPESCFRDEDVALGLASNHHGDGLEPQADGHEEEPQRFPSQPALSNAATLPVKLRDLLIEQLTERLDLLCKPSGIVTGLVLDILHATRQLFGPPGQLRYCRLGGGREVPISDSNAGRAARKRQGGARKRHLLGLAFVKDPAEKAGDDAGPDNGWIKESILLALDLSPCLPQPIRGEEYTNHLDYYGAKPECHAKSHRILWFSSLCGI